jgi:hypothetical protein
MASAPRLKHDFTGQQIGHLRVTGRLVGPSRNAQVAWHCVCECGVICERVTSYLLHRLRSSRYVERTSCSCVPDHGTGLHLTDSQGRFASLDLSGLRFGRLLVLRPAAHDGRSRSRLWHVRCDCGTETIRSAARLRNARWPTRHCGCSPGYRAINSEGPRIEDPRARRVSQSAWVNRIYRTYRHNALRLGRDFTLTREDVSRLVMQCCAYCGASSMNTSHEALVATATAATSFAYNGMDRVDSRRGYTLDNVVSCCRVCNFAKGKMHGSDFLAWVQRVAEHQRHVGQANVS